MVVFLVICFCIMVLEVNYRVFGIFLLFLGLDKLVGDRGLLRNRSGGCFCWLLWIDLFKFGINLML